MKNYRVKLMKPAKEGLLEIAEYIALDNPTRALSFIEELTHTLKKTLSSFPHAGRPYTEIEGEIRTVPYGNYVSYYRVKEEEKLVEVLFIFNAKRDVTEFLQNI